MKLIHISGNIHTPEHIHTSGEKNQTSGCHTVQYGEAEGAWNGALHCHATTPHGQTTTNFPQAIEAPDQEYVMARSFPEYDPADYAMFKVKTQSIGCGNVGDFSQSAVDATDGTPPYLFERGEHR